MLKDKLSRYRVILASGSPRRQHFLRELGLDFVIEVKEVDESFPDHLKGGDITAFLSELKSEAFGPLGEHDILITSDTIVWLEDRALGKPTDREDAIAMLEALSGRTHQVMTSVTFRTPSGHETLTETTAVTFNSLTRDEIEYYIDHYRPFDKAGSYGIQDWIGMVAVKRIDGSYANVMGLPVDRVYDYLNTHF
ncbi:MULTISPECIES: Maf family nucleotide pyrophosphatase [unclassified Flavobacterium]|uniref:Maf family nucleotide pyrophosphatase n=1 Tax=unclassified Flavobacterium TaxID=196869 RepID=UPI001F12B86D|nr:MULTISPECIES: Maf family nucleotide pyrophosphatase [unclassified Flavobacterium]UMY65217.1 Maf family nucleotide pyrophosphatase [Flavobacterium sp. HJ-32-4]